MSDELNRVLETRESDTQLAVVIVLRHETTKPIISSTARTKGDLARLNEWVLSQPDLRELLLGAMESAHGEDWVEQALRRRHSGNDGHGEDAA